MSVKVPAAGSVRIEIVPAPESRALATISVRIRRAGVSIAEVLEEAQQIDPRLTHRRSAHAPGRWLRRALHGRPGSSAPSRTQPSAFRRAPVSSSSSTRDWSRMRVIRTKPWNMPGYCVSVTDTPASRRRFA